MARKFYIDQDSGTFVKGPLDGSNPLPTEFFNGDDPDIELYFLRRTGVFGAPYVFEDKSAASLKVGLGPQRAPLSAGTWTITFGANTTTALAFGASASDVETALNLLASIISAGGVTVSKAANSARYRVTFAANGSRVAFSVDYTELIPDAVAIISERIPGDGSHQEVQEIYLSPIPAAFQYIFTDLPTTVTATVSTITDGSTSGSEVQKIIFTPNPTGATWSITIPSDTRTTTAAVTSGNFFTTDNHGFAVGQPITPTGFTSPANFSNSTTYYVANIISPTGFQIALTSGGAAITTATASSGTATWTTPARTANQLSNGATQADVETALQALDVIGTGGVSVIGVPGDNFVLTFTGAKANANFPQITVDASLLTAPFGKTGEFNLATFSMQDLFDASALTALNLVLEVQITESGRRQTYAADADVDDDIIKDAILSPTPLPSYYTASETDALFALINTRPAALTFSSAGSQAVTKGDARTRIIIQEVVTNAGSGPFTSVVYLQTTLGIDADIAFIACDFAASTDPTIEVRDATSGGTLLWTGEGTGLAQQVTPSFYFNGTAWKLLGIS